MAEYRRAEITSGLFIVLSVLVFALFAFKVGGLSLAGLFGADGTEFFAYFDDVRELDTQAKVAVGGHRVGVVRKMESFNKEFSKDDVARLKDGGADLEKLGVAVGKMRPVVKVTFAVEEAGLLLGRNATVKIAQEGFIGPIFILLNPGTWDAAAPPKPVGEAQGAATEIGSEPGAGLLDDFKSKFAPTIRSLDNILRKFDQDLLSDATAADRRELIPLLRSDLDDARGVLRQLNKLIDPADADSVQATVLKPAGRLIGRLDTASGRLDDLLKEALPEAKRLLASANDAADEATRTLTSLRKVVDDLAPGARAAMSDLELLTHGLAEKTKNFQEIVDHATKISKDAESGVGDAAALLREARPNLAELIRTARNAAWELELAVRKVRANPAVVLWGDKEKLLDAEPRDESGLRRTGRAKPYHQRDEGATEATNDPAPPAPAGGGK